MKAAPTKAQYLAGIFLLAAVYFAAGKLGLALAFLNESVTLVWPPTGIALAAAMALGRRVWPGIFLGAFGVNLSITGHIASSLGIATGNTLEAVLGAWLIERFAGGTKVFEGPKGIFQFLFLAGTGNLVSATLGVLSLGLGNDWEKLLPTWWTWWLGDTVGALLVTPALIAWWREPRLQWTTKQVLLAGFLFSLLLSAGIFVFGDFLPVLSKNYPLAFIFLPLLIWIAFQFGLREAATATLLLDAIAIWELFSTPVPS